MAQVIRAVGTMSGTSLDGVDAALVETDGVTIKAFGETGYRAYTEAERTCIRAGFGRDAEARAVAAAAEVVETAHAVVLSDMPGGDVVGFHGQTLFHAPVDGITVQAGDGAVLAAVLGVPVVWDFRRSDVEMGGQGAPLAPFFHHACARYIGAEAPIAFLNLGGVGNLTWVDPRVIDPAEDGALLAFDTGPANAPIDDLMGVRRGEKRDDGGALAASGQVLEAALAEFLEDPYFLKVPPKSLDRNAFAGLQAQVQDLKDADAAATLTAAAAAAVLHGVAHCPAPPARVLVSGGGRHNAEMMRRIRAGLGCAVEPIEAVGLDGDMLEAQAFAYLAVRVLRGLPTSAPGTTGVAAPVGGGQVSRPEGAPVGAEG